MEEDVTEPFLSQLEQRTQEPAADRRNPGKACRSGPTHDPHQHGLRLVASRVGEQDPRRPDLGRDRFERGVPRVACGGFERCSLGDLDPRTTAATPCPRAQAATCSATSALFGDSPWSMWITTTLLAVSCKAGRIPT